jgi:tRNA pseudouridine55 synthase
VVPVVKPAGPTSHDVVDRARRRLQTRRIGHLGTLDPFAAGLLILVVGRATRLARYAAEWRKTYEGVIRLGRTTTTDDATGQPVRESRAWESLERHAVALALARFRGGYAQRPPAYSARKVDGERAYRRARRGESIALGPRPVAVWSLDLVAFEPPDVRFRAEVGAGTYLRSLARDLGDALGCGAHLLELRRTIVGPFTLDDAVAPDALTRAALRDAAILVRDLPRRDLDAAERDAIVHGRPIPVLDGKRATGNVALFHDARLVAVAELDGEVLKPRVVVADG